MSLILPIDEVLPSLTSEQESGLDKVIRWYTDFKNSNFNGSVKNFFRLCGFAGTGKTFLANRIIYEISQITYKGIAVVAFTHQACDVLRSKGVRTAQTIHSFLYNVTYDKDMNPIFTRKTTYEISDEFDFIVVDEASMVNSAQRAELESFGLPVLYLGDNGQLPPISNDPNDKDFLKNPEHLLTEVRRNVGPIVKLSMDIRNGIYIPKGKYADGVFIIDESRLSDELLLKSDQVITGKNVTRKIYNDDIRALKGINHNNFPSFGEPIVILNNNVQFGLFNGFRIYSLADLNEIKLKGKASTVPYITVDNIDEHASISNFMISLLDVNPNVVEQITDLYPNKKFNRVNKVNLFFDGSVKFDSSRDESIFLKTNKAVKCDFAYATTCHKSQGSAYKKPIVVEEYLSSDKEFHKKWLYTAVTRAEEKLIIVR